MQTDAFEEWASEEDHDDRDEDDQHRDDVRHRQRAPGNELVRVAKDHDSSDAHLPGEGNRLRADGVVLAESE